MLQFVTRRLLWIVLTLLFVSVLTLILLAASIMLVALTIGIPEGS